MCGWQLLVAVIDVTGSDIHSDRILLWNENPVLLILSFETCAWHHQGTDVVFVCLRLKLHCGMLLLQNPSQIVIATSYL